LTVAPVATSSPTITSADHATFKKGTAGTFTVTTAPGVPATTTITRTGTLPSGVTFTDNHNGTATLAGTPTVSGVYPITIKASNGTGTAAQQSFTLTVTKPPSITSAGSASFPSGTAKTFTVTTTPGVPTTTTLSYTGTLPAGVTFTDNHNGTATLAGTATVSTTTNYPIVITASNGVSPNATQHFTLTVTAPVAAVPLPAKPPAPNGALQGLPSRITVGKVVTVSGSGYKAGAPIEIGWYYPRTVIRHAVADSAGRFSATFVVPNQTGTKALYAAGMGSNGKARYLAAKTSVSGPR
jgi:hypothetical protein